MSNGYGWGELAGDVAKIAIPYWAGKAGETSGKDVGEDYGQMYAASYPDIMKAIRTELIPTGEAELLAQRHLTPQQQRLAWETAQGSEGIGDYKPGFVPGAIDYVGLEGEADYWKRRLAAGTDKTIMDLQGPYMAENVMDQLAVTDQPWMHARDTGAAKLQELLGSINMGGLSGGERAEIERMNARRNLQRGSAGGGGNLTAIENAMQFGSAMDRKRAALGNALQTATNFMAGSRSGYDPVQAVLGRGSGTNQIAAGFQGVQPVQNYANQMPVLPEMANAGQSGNFVGRVTSGMDTLNKWFNYGD